jgi:NAD(P)-dependent dehydrogenase (short-subunit alcohol dehydrogenase family)
MATLSVLIIGASRGIGLEMARHYRAMGAKVVGTVRSAPAAQVLRELGAKPLTLDVSQAASVSGLAWQIDGEAFDHVWINAGVFGPRLPTLTPPTQHDFDQVMHVNVLGPMRVLPQLQEALAPGARVGLVSSRMGSMALRTNPQHSLYRASKAALNSLMADTALAWQGRAVVASFHPGWVRTDMGGPEADIEVHESVQGLVAQISSLTPQDSGSFIDHQGERLAF